MPDDLRSRARAALAGRLRELLPPGALHADGTHATEFADALVPTLSAADVAWARAQLAARAKGELRPTRARAVPAHAAWSSTGLVCSAFAPWREAVPLRLEERIPIPHGGGNPNLDVAIDLPDGELIGVESKLTEHLAPARPRPWKPAYHRPAMREALHGGWRDVFDDLLAGRWAPRHLDAGQLVRHALSLRGRHALLLVFWEPANAADHPECARHRDELAELTRRVAGAPPAFSAVDWATLLDAWEPERPAHVAALRDRYAVAV